DAGGFHAQPSAGRRKLPGGGGVHGHYNGPAMTTHARIADRAANAVNRARLLETAKRLVAVPSRTGEAGAAADRLAEILRADGFTVERPVAGHPAAPAVAVRFDSGRPGRLLQFDGHLDTVHLPFVPPGESDGRLTGSGASDMKGGLAAAVEALRALRDADALTGGSVLLVAHDLHEAPWGLGQQLDALIRAGVYGDGGEIYNQYPQECFVEGTRRWLPGTDRSAVEAEFRRLLDGLARDRGVTDETRFTFIRDAFRLDGGDPLVAAFQAGYAAVTGRPL